MVTRATRSAAHCMYLANYSGRHLAVKRACVLTTQLCTVLAAGRLLLQLRHPLPAQLTLRIWGHRNRLHADGTQLRLEKNWTPWGTRWLEGLPAMSDAHAPDSASWSNSIAICAVMKDEQTEDVHEWLQYYQCAPTAAQ
jgi:hypothetical protein